MNYQLKLDEIIKSLDGKTSKLLLHACCGPCSSYVLEYLSEFFEITILYYNPNIYPEEEYKRRFEELKKFVSKINYKNKVNVIEKKYDAKEYYDAVKGLEHLGEKSERCYECYKLRMEQAAIYAKENNYDYFTTTLSISPYKVSSWINEIGEKLENKYNIKYLYSDFKKNNGYKRSQELSKEFGMYRQDYCGCVYSFKERQDYEVNKLNNLFNDVINIYNLGNLIDSPIQNKIGITNKIYELNTSSGKYILKILSKKDIDNIELSEELANYAYNSGINALTAIKLNNKYINTINGENVILYPYYEGKVLLTKELTLEHIKVLANSLAKLHSLKIIDNYTNTKYIKNDYKKLYELSLDNDNECFNLFKENIDKLLKIYDEVYDSYSKLSNQLSYVHRDFNRKNVLWKDNEFRIIDWETSTIDNPSIDFFNSIWFLSNDFEEEKSKVFIKEYFSIMKLNDDYNIGVKAALIEECNWLYFSLNRALRLITNNGYEIKLGEDSIESSIKEIINYYDKIDLILKYINE